MFERIIVPLDGSILAEEALLMASRLARTADGTVILLRVVSPPVEYTSNTMFMNYTPTDILEKVVETDLADARHYLEAVATSHTLQGVHTELEVHIGAAAARIIAVADALRCTAIVMSSHGRTGLKRWLLGSVAQHVIRSSSLPVLIVHGQELSSVHGTAPRTYIERPLRVLVPLDGSAATKAALQPAVQVITALAAPGQGAIHLLRVMKPETHAGKISDATTREHELHEAKIDLQTVMDHIRTGLTPPFKGLITWSLVPDTDPAAAIIRVAENGEDAEGAGVFGGCKIIAMTTHGRKGLQRWTMGSVTERVLSGTRLPVLIIRPHITDSASKAVGTQTMDTSTVQASPGTDGGRFQPKIGISRDHNHTMLRLASPVSLSAEEPIATAECAGCVPDRNEQIRVTSWVRQPIHDVSALNSEVERVRNKKSEEE